MKCHTKCDTKDSGRSHKRGTTWDRGIRGDGITKAFMEKVPSERNLKGCVQLQQAELMYVRALGAFWCDVMMGVAGGGRSRRRATKESMRCV